MRNKKAHCYGKLGILITITAVMLSLASCKSDKQSETQPSKSAAIPSPDTYEVQKTSVPAFPVGKDIEVYYLPPEVSEETEETQDPSAPKEIPDELDMGTYRYENVSDLSGRVQDYSKLLMRDEFGFSCIDEKHAKTELPDPMPENGKIQLALPITIVTEDGMDDFLFSIRMEWEEKRLTVNLEQLKGNIKKQQDTELDGAHRPIHGVHGQNSLTVSEATDLFYSIKPEELKLQGDKMSDYLVIVLDGAVMVGKEYCMRVHVYEVSPVTDTNVIAGMYLMNGEGSHFYKTDLNGNLTMLNVTIPNK